MRPTYALRGSVLGGLYKYIHTRAHLRDTCVSKGMCVTEKAMSDVHVYAVALCGNTVRNMAQASHWLDTTETG